MTKRKPDQPTTHQPKIMKIPKSMKLEAAPADNSSESTKLTQQETQLYDRQIRLWGLDAQQSLRNAKLLVIGVTSFSNELLKNIVLTGVDTITICTTSLVTARNIGAQFLIDKSKIGLNIGESIVERLLKLNPKVRVQSFEYNAQSLPLEILKAHQIVMDFDSSPGDQINLDSKCRLHNVKFYSCRSHGVYSYIYSNLHDYTFQTTRKVTGSTGETKVTNSTTYDYSTLKQVIDHKFEAVDVGKKRWKRQYSPLYFAVIVDIKFCLKNSRYATTKDSKSLLLLKNETLTKMNVPVDFLADDLLLKIVELRNVELMPVSAIMGGFLAQEAVKVITGKEVPFNNFFVFDATELSTLLMTV